MEKANTETKASDISKEKGNIKMHRNEFVDELNQYHPLNASFGKAIAERDNELEAPSELDASLRNLLLDGRTRMIILTGDAGQGKNLCL